MEIHKSKIIHQVSPVILFAEHQQKKQQKKNQQKKLINKKFSTKTPIRFVSFNFNFLCI